MVYIKIYIYPHLIFYFKQKSFNLLKNFLFEEILAINQLIIIKKNVIIWKKSLAIVTLSIKIDLIIEKNLKWWIIKYKVDDDKDIAYYFKDSLIDTYNDYILNILNCMSNVRLPSFENSNQYKLY